MNKYVLEDLKVEVTHRCTLACIHCSSNSIPSNELEMQYEECKRIIESACAMGVKNISFSGGEPLIWSHIEKVVELSASMGINTTIYSSGNIDNFPRMISTLANSRLNKIIFSLYSSNNIEHGRITRKLDSFDRTIYAIKAAKRYPIEIELHFVALRRNYLKLPDVLALCERIGVPIVSVLRFVPQGRGSFLKKDIMNHYDYIKLKTIIEAHRSGKIQIRTGSPFNFLMVNRYPKCLSAQDRLIIGPQLNLYPCDAFKQFEAFEFLDIDDYANLNKHQLETCWEKSSYLNLIRKSIGNLGSVCLECKYNVKCGSGCLAQKKISYGDLCNRPDPACIMGKGVV